MSEGVPSLWNALAMRERRATMGVTPLRSSMERLSYLMSRQGSVVLSLSLSTSNGRSLWDRPEFNECGNQSFSSIANL
jgi:hypothetical protein